MSLSEKCVCYVCAGMRSWRVSVPGLRGKEDDPSTADGQSCRTEQHNNTLVNQDMA